MTPTLEIQSKQKQEANNKPVCKHEQVQPQVQDPNPAKIEPKKKRTNEQATTSELVKNICIFNDD